MITRDWAVKQDRGLGARDRESPRSPLYFQRFYDIIPLKGIKIKRRYFGRLAALLNHWRFYGLEPDEYRKCVKQNFITNLYGLRQASFSVFVLAAVFALFPLLIEKNLVKLVWHLIAAFIALFMGIYLNHKCRQHKQGKEISRKFIYVMITLYYVNVITFGVYLGIWSNPGKIAVSFMVILICALFLYIISPLFILSLTLAAMAVFITLSVMVKTFDNWTLDMINALFAGYVGLFFGWQSTMFRMSLISTANKFQNERDSYYQQSTVDELTQLKNRRDFTQTFQRFLTNYRQSDKFLCIALLDIDFFKNYNDHYGHLMGDECLRSIGRTLKKLQESEGIYNARVGGEEFALVWFEDKIEDVKEIASRINQMVIDLKIPHAKSAAAPYVTVSVGVHVVPCGSSGDKDVLYDLADKALYAAKSEGRNRAVITIQP
jgi:diguanylate cyclase (GGDEF)-like protein